MAISQMSLAGQLCLDCTTEKWVTHSVSGMVGRVVRRTHRWKKVFRVYIREAQRCVHFLGPRGAVVCPTVLHPLASLTTTLSP